MNEPVRATVCESEDQWWDLEQPGAAYFSDTHAYLTCPCGCHQSMVLAIRRPGTERTRSPQWEFNGDLAKPTLAPSIRDLSGCRFHGFLTDGVWTFCGDSGR